MRIASALMLLVATAAASAAQDFPTSHMPAYAEFRAQLLKYGWKPDEAYGDKASYGFAEVICGNSMCSAQWLGQGEPLHITLWNDDSGVLRVAPQTDRGE